MKKRFLSILLALCVAMMMSPTMVLAENNAVIATGYCGADTSYQSQTYSYSTTYNNNEQAFTDTYYSNAIWTITKNNSTEDGAATYTLKITGTGAVKDFGESWSFGRPWHFAIAEATKGSSYVGTDVIAAKNSITAIEIGDGITEIGAHTFEAYPITSITIPDSVAKIGEDAFNYCEKVSTITFGSGLKEIGQCAFGSCKGVTSITLPDGLKTIGASAFNSLTNLTGDLTIPDSVETIGEGAFWSTGKLNGTLTIGASANNIAKGTFGQNGFTKLVLKNGLTTISAGASASSGNYTGHLSIPDSVTTIVEDAFYGFQYSSVQLGKSVINIGKNAFTNCTSVHSLDLTAVENTITCGESAFASLKNPNTVYVKNEKQKEGISNALTSGRSAFAITNGGVIPTNTTFTAETLATPTKEGYTFGGWYNNANFTGETVTAPASGQTYYAKWTYNVNFNGNGSTSGSMDAQTVTDGDTTTTLSTNGFTKTGYTFSGWNTEANGSGTTYAADAKASAVPVGTTLYAQWTPNTYTIQFNGGEGVTGSMSAQTMTYDTAANLTANTFNKVNCKFAGWATTQNGAAAYADGTQVNNLTETANGSVNLYAVWTEKQVWNPDVTPQTKTYNDKAQAFKMDSDYTVSYKQNDQAVAAPTNAGSYDVVITREGDDKHAAYQTTVSGGLVINPATLIIRATDQSVRVGSTLPTYTYTVTGLCENNSLEAEPTLTCTADGKTTGTFDIVPNGADAGANYNITYQNGKLTVYRSGSSYVPADNTTDTTGTTAVTVKPSTTTATDGTKTVTATVDNTTASKIVEKTVANKSTEIILNAATSTTVKETAAGTNMEITLPEQTVKAIAEKTDAVVTIKTDAAEVTFDKEAVKAIAAAAGTNGTVKLIVNTIAQDENKVQIELKLETSNGSVYEFKGGSVKVTVKLGTALAAKNVACVYIDHSGIYHKVSGAKNVDGTYTFTTGHFSDYAIMALDEADGVIAEQTAKAAELIKALSLKARSAKTKAGNIKITLTADDDAIKAIEDLGYTVKYKFYRSTKKAKDYKAKLEGTGKTYTNTTGKKGTKYYYKARVMIYDAQGELIAKSALNQCKYASRTK